MDQSRLNPAIACLLPAAILLLAGCAPKMPEPPPPNTMEASLSEASYSVSRSITSLSEAAEAARPIRLLEPPLSPAAYGMGKTATIDWSGPVEPVTKEIAHATGYHLRVLGRAPAIPVMVSVYDRNRMIGDILRDIGYQCGRRASIVVFPESQVIELRYAKN